MRGSCAGDDRMVLSFCHLKGAVIVCRCTLSQPLVLLRDSVPSGRNHRAALALLGGAGLHIAAAEPAGAVHQLIAGLAPGQAGAVIRLGGADGFVQPGNVFRHGPGHVLLARLKEQAAAGLFFSHGSGQAQPD